MDLQINTTAQNTHMYNAHAAYTDKILDAVPGNGNILIVCIWEEANIIQQCKHSGRLE